MQPTGKRRDVTENGGRWQIHDLNGLALGAVQAGAVLVFGVSFAAGMVLRGVLRGTSGMSVSLNSLTPVLVLLASIPAAVLLHEAIHAALFRYYGGRPRLGVKLIGHVLPVAYATSTVSMPRDRYLLVCLAPCVVLTSVLLPVGIAARSDAIAVLALLLMALNAGGSVGDLVTARMLLRHEPATVFQDTEDGFNWRRSYDER